MNSKPLVLNGTYRHYKGNLYKLHQIVRHSESLEELVFYETLYENVLGKWWVRPKSIESDRPNPDECRQELVMNGARLTSNDWKQESGPLKTYFADPAVSEIMVNRWDSIFIEKNGIIEAAEYKFANAEALNRFIQSLCAILGKELNRKSPYLDARLPDGSRLNIVIPPVAVDGASITIRKATVSNFNYQTLMKSGAADEKLIYFLKQAVSCRQNIIISGGTGSGKTTVLGVLSSFISPKERVVCIEDTAEIQINVKNLVRMETREAIADEAPIETSDLLKNALRMRPDRIIVGECRGPEAFDMLMAMNTGHEGSMSSIHANSANDALRRLEAMIVRSGIQAPLAMIANDIASTIHLVVQTARTSDGKRKITEVIEVCGRQDGAYITQKIFEIIEPFGICSTGHIPQFIEDSVEVRGKFPAQFFDPAYKVKLSA
jgi:pilus assembly protein CpaF